MKRVPVVVVGAGHAGLAMSRCLTDRGLEHVVLDRRPVVAPRWSEERWEGLRLLTPNWMTRLPGWRYSGADPEGFMTMPEVARFLADYARSFDAPVHAGTTVRRVEPAGRGYRVATDRGDWLAGAVVVATGDCDRPFVPTPARHLATGVYQTVPTRYSGPSGLPPGGVLVVGASASGVQIAEQLRRDGRDVVLSVGRHTRLPRRYRGRDIMEWLDRTGILDDRFDAVGDIDRARRQPSLQLVGSDDGRMIDLERLARTGVTLAGRLAEAEGTRVAFADDLPRSVLDADRRLGRLLARIDGAIAADEALAAVAAPPDPPRSFTAAPGPADIDLADAEIRSVVWATGFRRAYPWLAVPVLDGRGEIAHHGGVTAAPGLVVLGLRFLRRRKSSFIDGAGPDAEILADHLARSFATGLCRAA